MQKLPPSHQLRRLVSLLMLAVTLVTLSACNSTLGNRKTLGVLSPSKPLAAQKSAAVARPSQQTDPKLVSASLERRPMAMPSEYLEDPAPKPPVDFNALVTGRTANPRSKLRPQQDLFRPSYRKLEARVREDRLGIDDSLQRKKPRWRDDDLLSPASDEKFAAAPGLLPNTEAKALRKPSEPSGDADLRIKTPGTPRAQEVDSPSQSSKLSDRKATKGWNSTHKASAASVRLADQSVVPAAKWSYDRVEDAPPLRSRDNPLRP